MPPPPLSSFLSAPVEAAFAAPVGVDWGEVAWSYQGESRSWLFAPTVHPLGCDQTDLDLLGKLIPVEAHHDEAAIVDAEETKKAAATVQLVLQRQHLLGAGNFGKVVMTKVTYGGGQETTLVVKKGEFFEREVCRSLQREAAFVRHVFGEPARVSFYNTQESRSGEVVAGSYVLVCPYCPGVTLAKYLKDKALPLEKRLKVLDAILEKLAWLHKEKRVIHGDLNAANIMVQEVGDTYNVNFVDFGFSYTLDEPAIKTPNKSSTTYFHPDRCGDGITISDREVRASTWHDVYSLLLLGNLECFSFLKNFRCIYEETSIADIRKAIHAKMLLLRASEDVQAQAGAMGKLLFGDKGDELNEGIHPEHYESHAALLAWIQAQSGDYGQLTVEMVAIIPLAKIRERYKQALRDYCRSKAVVTVSGELVAPEVATPVAQAAPRRVFVAQCADAGALKTSPAVALPARFGTAEDELLASEVRRARVGVLYDHIVHEDNKLLRYALMSTSSAGEFYLLLSKLDPESEMGKVAQNLSLDEAELLFNSTTNKAADLSCRAGCADQLAAWAELGEAPAGFEEATGLKLVADDWGTMKAGFADRSSAYYKLCFEYLVADLEWFLKDKFGYDDKVWKSSPLCTYYSEEAKAESVDWKSLARQASFSCVLVCGHEEYRKAKAETPHDINDKYTTYVLKCPAEHNLNGLCAQVDQRCGRFGGLNQHSFLPQVLGRSAGASGVSPRDFPWHKEFFVGEGGIISAKDYRDESYMTGAGYDPVKGCFFGKTSAVVARQELLADVRAHLETVKAATVTATA